MAVDQLLDTEAIGRQLERVLASPVFKSSKRTSLLLRFIVARTLEGRADLLKERVLGAEVFGRSSDYDTGSDHVVRSTAGEIRKRLAQYYLQPECEAEIRIELLPGSYVPQFRVPECRPTEQAPPTGTALPTPVRFADPHRSRRRIALATAATITFALAVWLAALYTPRGDAVHRFWGTLLDSDVPITICIGDPRSSWSGSEADAFRDFPFNGPNHAPSPAAPSHFWFQRTVPVGDALTAARLFSLIGGKAGGQRMVYGPESTLSDLRQNSAVLVGGIDNFWSMSLTRDLRYRFQLDSGAGMIFIEDVRKPADRAWQVPLDLPRSAVTVDYAIVARLVHPATGRPIVIAGGIRDCGTIAAGEFLTSTAYLSELERRAPKHWTNVEAVLSTKVLRGTPGPPQLVAAYFW
jgi:hypothetical protein